MARRARHVVLLTATPHAGDERSYRALCAIGSLDRRRPDASLPQDARTGRPAAIAPRATCWPLKRRRLASRCIACSTITSRSSGRSRAASSRRDVQLVAMVLAKRAFSSARSLATSLERRLTALSSNADGARPGCAAARRAKTICRTSPQCRWRVLSTHSTKSAPCCSALIDAARRDGTRRAKDARAEANPPARARAAHHLHRVSRHARGAYAAQLAAFGTSPRSMAAKRHAGTAAIAVGRSPSGAADVMIATDAGSEGLNLQGRCRLVVNLELPWNPIRLEQRIGRVDRIGQTRTVHAINLLADGTAERTVLASSAAADRSDPAERNRDRVVRHQPDGATLERRFRQTPCTESIDLERRGSRRSAPCFARTRGFSAVCSKRSGQIIPVTVVRSPAASLIVVVFAFGSSRGAGRLIEDTLVPVRVPIDSPRTALDAKRRARAGANRWQRASAPSWRATREQHADRRACAIALESAHSIARAVSRERAIADILAPPAFRWCKPASSTDRALKEKRAEEDQRDFTQRESGARADLLEADARFPARARSGAGDASHPMLTGLSGSLVSHYFAERMLPQEFSGRLGEASRASAGKAFARWWNTQASQLGPASSIRAIWDLAAAPLVELLGFAAMPPASGGPDTQLRVAEPFARPRRAGCRDIEQRRSTPCGATSRGEALDSTPHGCCARTDASCVWSTRSARIRRAHLQFDLQQASLTPRPSKCSGDCCEKTLSAMGPATRLSSWKSSAPPPDMARRSAARCASASSRRFSTFSAAWTSAVQHDLSRLFDESLTVVYRVLFLMFAESRGLVPNWHPIYRESYTVESLRDRVERPGSAPGIWEALQAIARLAHSGCRAGSLVVPPFNGRLFSPARAPIAESCAVDDEVARHALLALSTTTSSRLAATDARSARGSTTGTWASSSSARSTRACSTTSPR